MKQKQQAIQQQQQQKRKWLENGKNKEEKSKPKRIHQNEKIANEQR